MHQNASCCRILFVYHNHMENYFTQFPAGQKIEAPDGLLDKVMSRIIAEKRLRLRRRLFGILMLLLASIAGAVPAGQAFWNDVTGSGLNLYLTLAFYDWSAILNNWQDFSFTILESLPVISAAALLGAGLAVLLTLKYAIQYYEKISPSSLLFKTIN